MEGSRLAPNFSIVTLGVTDLTRSIRFYETLGWSHRGDAEDGIVWFKTSGTWIGLYGYEALAADAGLEAVPATRQPAFRGMTLAINLPSEEAVDRGFERVRAAGGAVVKAPARAEWGGYSGYFADPDGVLWEIAYAPGFAIDMDGRIEIS